MKSVYKVILVGFLALFFPFAVQAAEFRSQEGSTTISEDEQVKNPYVAGDVVNISGRVLSDLVGAGKTINLSGNVENSAICAAETINFSGEIGRNARFFANSVVVSGLINEDLLSGSASLSIAEDSRIGGDVVAAASQIIIDGNVSGKVLSAGEKLTINGRVEGDVEVYGNEIILGDEAFIGGNFKYHSQNEANISSSAIIEGESEFVKVQGKDYSRGFLRANIIGTNFLGAIMSVVLLLVVVYLLPKLSRNAVEANISKFYANILWGFIALIVVPAAIIFIVITVLGLKIAGALMLAYVVALSVAGILSTLVLGETVMKLFGVKQYRVDWATALVGAGSVFVLSIIPFLGQLVIFVFMLSALGSITVATENYLRSQRRS